MTFSEGAINNLILNDIIGPEVAREKAGYMARQAPWAKQNHLAGSQQQEALGQKVGTVDMATYLRWNQEVPGCWNDPGFVKKFMASNPECACKTKTW